MMAEDQSTMGGGDSPHPDVTALSESAATSGTSNSATTARTPPISSSEQYEGRDLVKTSEEEAEHISIFSQLVVYACSVCCSSSI